jgi:hypothetical protein
VLPVVGPEFRNVPPKIVYEYGASNDGPGEADEHGDVFEGDHFPALHIRAIVSQSEHFAIAHIAITNIPRRNPAPNAVKNSHHMASPHCTDTGDGAAGA